MEEKRCPYCGAELEDRGNGEYWCEVCQTLFVEENGEMVPAK